MAAPDERSYRRGLILGLTMAEVMILVLFALLLIWMIGLRDRKHETTELRTTLERLKVENAQLQSKAAELLEVKKALASQSGSPPNIDDLFRELTLSKEETARVQEQLRSRDLVAETLGALGYPIRDQHSATETIKDIKAKLEIANSVLQSAKGQSKRAAADDQIVEKLGSLAQIERALSSKGKDIGAAASECSDALTRETDCNTRLNTVSGRLANAEQQLATSSRGTEKPACWADQTGKPEYIFDIALESQSIVIRDNALPNRRSEEASLPLEKITFDAELKPEVFRNQTRALFDWSEREKCRFFVRVFDLTAAFEKDIYKRQLRTVGEHFYYYEELTRTWNTDHGTGTAQ